MTTQAIKKLKKIHQDPLSFDSLRATGFELSQTLSGDSWTDYNVHDPGVTILEHLCFAISDLAYRMDFPIADYLTEESTIQSLDELNLFNKDIITECSPISKNDLIKLILNQIPSLEDIVIDYSSLQTIGVETQQYPTLLLSVRPDSNNTVSPQLQHQVLNEVKKAYAKNRLLGEDIKQVVICQNRFYQLVADVEINNSYKAEAIMAAIYFNCAGDLTPNDTDDNQWQDAKENNDVPLSYLHTIINSLKNVVNITSLYVIDPDGNRQSALHQSNKTENARIFIPESAVEVQVNLFRKGRKIDVDFDGMQLCYKELLSKQLTLNASQHKPSAVQSIQINNPEKFSQYVSIQNLFPKNFGIGHLSLPTDKYPRRRAKALQLKGYITLFEYVLLDKLDCINGIKNLFAPLKFSQSPNKLNQNLTAIPNIEQLLTDNVDKDFPSNKEAPLSFHKATKVLDYLLALYGESTSAKAVTQFSFYHYYGDTQQRVYDNKLRLLANIVNLNKNRGKGLDLAVSNWKPSQLSGLQLKCSLLLDFQRIGIRSMCSAVVRHNIKVIFDKPTAQSALQEPFAEFMFTGNEINEQFDDVEYVDLSPVTLDQLMHYFGNKFICKDKGVSANFLRGVVNLRNLKIGVRPNQSEKQEHPSFCLVYFDEQSEGYYHLNDFADRESATLAANTLRHYFIQVNQQSEGMHIVEHGLLALHMGKKIAEFDPQIFHSQLTIVLPNWTARTATKAFQFLAEETIATHTPAHLYPHIIWLDLAQMHLFEAKYRDYLVAVTTVKTDDEKIHQATYALTRVIQQLHQKKNQEP